MSFEPETTPRASGRSALVAALSVYAEPLVERSRVLLVGDASPDVWALLLDMGAESITVVDHDVARARRVAALAPRGVTVRGDAELALDMRDGAFDLAILADVSRLADPEAVVRRLRRVVDAAGAVVALGRAQSEGPEAFTELSSPTLDYEGLYDLFALSFEHVTMAGVLPFSGIVFAELGADTEDVAVSVDTRLAPEATPPSVFVVLASREARALDPYAIVQASTTEGRARSASSEAAFAAMQLRAELLASQLEEMRSRLAQAEASPRSARVGPDSEREIARLRKAEEELTSALTRVALERDAALVRIVELESTSTRLAEGAATLERRIRAAEQSVAERERAVAIAQGELEHVARQHAAELLGLEEQLQERARTVAEHEREIGRREELVRDLVGRLEELREGSAAEPPPLPPEPAPRGAAPEEVRVLEAKLDALALDVARRESEIVARGWKVRELDAALGRAQGEIDALRQALAQEHAARTAAEAAARGAAREGRGPELASDVAEGHGGG